MLLIYTASASEPTRPSDWIIEDIERGLSRHSEPFARLEISLRDPFMSGALPGEGVLAPPLPASNTGADQCPPGVAWHDGDACVVAVVRFNGTILSEPVNITTYASVDGQAGTALRTTQTSGGVTILRLPPAAKVGATFYYAKVKHVERRGGRYQGQDFSLIGHYATTSTILQRPPKAPAPPPPSPMSPPLPSIPPYPVQPAPPRSPPPEPIPAWMIRQLSDNSFGGAFGAISLWLVLLGLAFGAARAYKNREAIRAAMGSRRGEQTGTMAQGMLGPGYQPSGLDGSYDSGRVAAARGV